MELLRRYSNRPDLLNALVKTLELVKAPQDHSSETATSVQGRTARAAWRMADRLSEADIAALLSSYLAGDTMAVVAARYGIGTTSLKKLLRAHEVRKNKIVAEQPITDEQRIQHGIIEALQGGRPIDHAVARTIAAQLHGGQTSPLYALASSGAVAEGLRSGDRPISRTGQCCVVRQSNPEPTSPTR